MFYRASKNENISIRATVRLFLCRLIIQIKAPSVDIVH